MVSDFWEGKRVLVTGATGLIGGPLCKLLLERGALVTGYDLETVGTFPAHGLVGKVPVIQGSILNRSEMEEALRGEKVCIHLAAISGVEEARRQGIQAWEVNVRGTWMLLDACASTPGVEAFVGASSNHIYGEQGVKPTPEDAPFNQLDTYSATKAAMDILIRSYAHNYGLRTVVVRNTNCFGVGDPHTDHIIPGTILSVLRGEPPIIRSDGTRKKAYLYVNDVAEAYIAVAEWIMGRGYSRPGTAFNVTGKESISVLDLVKTIIRVMGSKVGYTVLGEPNDQSDEALDDTAIQTRVGWRPKVSLEAGIAKTADWMAKERGVKV